MKIKYQLRSGETITRDIQPGTKLVGIRLSEFTIETYEEAQKLMSEQGIKWFKSNVNFRISPQKESNWGSDWVDDGV